jgi:hypothetical protein
MLRWLGYQYLVQGARITAPMTDRQDISIYTGGYAHRWQWYQYLRIITCTVDEDLFTVLVPDAAAPLRTIYVNLLWREGAVQFLIQTNGWLVQLMIQTIGCEFSSWYREMGG